MAKLLPTPAQLRELLTSRLCRRITLLVCLSVLLVELAFLPPTYFTRREELFQRRELDVLQAATGMLNWYEVHTPEEMLKQSWDSFRNFAVDGVAIYNDRGVLLASQGRRPDLAPDADHDAGKAKVQRSIARGEDTALRSHGNGDFYEVLWPPSASRLPFTVVVRLDNAGINTELLGYLLRIGGLILVLSFCVSAITAAVLGRTVLSPLLEIHRKLITAHGDPVNAEKYKLDIDSDDEIGETADAINSLLTRLSDVRRDDLREREQRLSDFAASSSDWFWEMDEYLRFCFFSERFTEVTGVDQDLLLGKIRDAPGIPELDPRAWKKHENDLKEHRPFRNFVYPRKAADGQIIWLSINGIPVFDDHGNFRGYRGAGHDVTAEVATRKALMKAKDEAEAGNRAKSEFLANVSHELRTPLNAIIGFSEMMLATMPASDQSSRNRGYLEDIHSSALHLLSLINDILDLSKIEAGASVVEEDILDVPAVAEAVLRIVRQRAEQSAISVDLSMDSELPQLRADARKLKQALLNLLTNAVKFTPQGGKVAVIITCDLQEGFIFQVMDNGIGMAPEDIPVALRQFGQIDSSRNRKYEGTGLGLPLTKALVELHGGNLDLQSRLGQGTTVTLSFPAGRIVTPGAVLQDAAAG